MANRQDPRVLRTRQLIKEAFRTLLQRKGFDSITINDIAQRATINRATFYAHYEDKYALLDEITEQAFYERIPEQVISAHEFTDEICDQLILMTYNYIVDFYRECRMDSKPIATLVDVKIKTMLEQTVETIFLKGNTQPEANLHHTKIVSAMTSSAIYGAAYTWFMNGEENRTDVLANIVRPYVMNGLGLHRRNDDSDTN